MIKYIERSGNEIVAEFSDDKIVIANAVDIPDILGELGMNDCNRIIIHEKNLHGNFFNLSTRIAGDILQKFSNYRVKLAIVADLSKFSSKSLNYFVRESYCKTWNKTRPADALN